MPDLQDIESRLSKNTKGMFLPVETHLPNDYEVISGGKFLNFAKDYNALAYNSPPEPTGWKFHISIAPADMQKAFDIVYEVAKKAELHYFKVTNEELTQKWDDATSQQRGKTFTITNSGEVGFENFLKETEQKLREAGIKPSHAVVGDRAVSGSLYLSYRNDGNTKAGGYLAAEALAKLSEAERYNPAKLPDPFKELAFSEVESIKYNAALSQLAEKPIVNTIAADLTRTESHIGRLPWMGMHKGGSEFYRVDASLLSKDLNNVYYALVGNGIEAELVKSNSDGRTYVEVADQKSMQRLNELQIKSTAWAQMPEKGASYTALPSAMQQAPALNYAREQFGVLERYANEPAIINSLVDAHRRQGIDVSMEVSDGQRRLSIPEHQIDRLRTFLGVSADNVESASAKTNLVTSADDIKVAPTEIRSPQIQSSVMNTALEEVKLVSAESRLPAMKVAAAGAAGLGVLGVASVGYTTYIEAEKQVEQGNPIGAGTVALNNAAAFVAGGVCSAGAASVAAPLLGIPVAGVPLYGAAVLGAGYSCSKAAMDASQYVASLIREHALNNGLDPEEVLKTLQMASQKDQESTAAVNTVVVNHDYSYASER